MAQVEHRCGMKDCNRKAYAVINEMYYFCKPMFNDLFVGDFSKKHTVWKVSRL